MAVRDEFPRLAAAEFDEVVTHSHVRRVQAYAIGLADALFDPSEDPTDTTGFLDASLAWAAGVVTGDADTLSALESQRDRDRSDAAWDEAIEAYYEEHDSVGTSGDARGPDLLQITPRGRTWEVRQVIDELGVTSPREMGRVMAALKQRLAREGERGDSR